jgi:hypothetical protein
MQTILDVIEEHKLPASAKAGVVAPVSVTISKGPTGLDPAQTSFFQALNIATKINKGAIEIVNDTKVVEEGKKVAPLPPFSLSRPSLCTSAPRAHRCRTATLTRPALLARRSAPPRLRC